KDRGDLGRCGAAREDRLHDGGHLVLDEIAALGEPGDGAVRRHARHAPWEPPGRRSRKLPSSRFPSRVRIDSGWNCTPSTNTSRWRTPMISPSSVQALRTSAAGSVIGSMTSEW